jgi:hypothetical protein
MKCYRNLRNAQTQNYPVGTLQAISRFFRPSALSVCHYKSPAGPGQLSNREVSIQYHATLDVAKSVIEIYRQRWASPARNHAA